MNKKAQFFLIAGILISIAILAVGNVYTFGDTTKQEEVVYDLSNQIQYETSQVIDSGIINEKSETQIVDDLENLTKHYAYLNPDSDITLLYGNSESTATQISYSGVDNSIIQEPLPSGETPSDTVIDKKRKVEIKVVKVSGEENKRIQREFSLDKGQNFYVVIRKKIHNEEFVIKK